MVVLKDLTCPVGDAAPDTTIDLHKELGECIMRRSESIQLRDGESIRMEMNRGVLMVLGEAHIHPVPQEGRIPQNAGTSGLFSWWSWMYVLVSVSSFRSKRLSFCQVGGPHPPQCHHGLSISIRILYAPFFLPSQGTAGRCSIPGSSVIPSS